MAADLYVQGTLIQRADFDNQARRLAQVFLDMGLSADDVIATLMRNDLAQLLVIEAARYVGLSYVAINWHAAPAEIQMLITDSAARLLVGHSDLLAGLLAAGPVVAHGALAVIQVPPGVDIQQAYGVSGDALPDVPALADLIARTQPFDSAAETLRGLYAFTSGSTGKPKGIRRLAREGGPDRWQVFKSLSRMMMKQSAGDRFYCAAPIYHSAPNTLVQISLAAGDVDVFLDCKFDAELFLQTVERWKITHAYIVPTMMIRLLKLPQAVRNRYDVSSLRYTVSTGSPCPRDVKEAMINWFGPIIHESYGASEIGFMTQITSEEALQRPGSVGKVFDGGSVKVLDDDGRQLGPGQLGTLYIHLPMFGDYEYTNVDSDVDSNGDGTTGSDTHRHGVFSTVGDMGTVDEDGYIYISDRKKDMIITGGANVFPAEIEAQLILMPEVSDCAVFGIPDPEFGEAIAAAVTVADGASLTLQDVRDFLSDRLAKFKLPRTLDIHTVLPRQDSGKIFKAKLRDPYWRDAGRQV